MVSFCVTGTVPSPERGYQLNDTSAEVSFMSF